MLLVENEQQYCTLGFAHHKQNLRIKTTKFTHSFEAKNLFNLYINSLYSRWYSKGFFRVPSAISKSFSMVHNFTSIHVV